MGNIWFTPTSSTSHFVYCFDFHKESSINLLAFFKENNVYNENTLGEEMGVDEIGAEEMGSRRSGMAPNIFSAFSYMIIGSFRNPAFKR